MKNRKIKKLEKRIEKFEKRKQKWETSPQELVKREKRENCFLQIFDCLMLFPIIAMCPTFTGKVIISVASLSIAIFDVVEYHLVRKHKTKDEIVKSKAENAIDNLSIKIQKAKEKLAKLTPEPVTFITTSKDVKSDKESLETSKLIIKENQSAIEDIKIAAAQDNKNNKPSGNTDSFDDDDILSLL